MPVVIVQVAVDHIREHFFQNILLPNRFAAHGMPEVVHRIFFKLVSFFHQVCVTGVEAKPQVRRGEFFLDVNEDRRNIGADPDVFDAHRDARFLRHRQDLIQRRADVVDMLLKGDLRVMEVVAHMDGIGIHAHILTDLEAELLPADHLGPERGIGVNGVIHALERRVGIHECQPGIAHFGAEFFGKVGIRHDHGDEIGGQHKMLRTAGGKFVHDIGAYRVRHTSEPVTERNRYLKHN